MLQQIKRRKVDKKTCLTKPTFGEIEPEKVISTLPKKSGQGNGITDMKFSTDGKFYILSKNNGKLCYDNTLKFVNDNRVSEKVFKEFHYQTVSKVAWYPEPGMPKLFLTGGITESIKYQKSVLSATVDVWDAKNFTSVETFDPWNRKSKLKSATRITALDFTLSNVVTVGLSNKSELYFIDLRSGACTQNISFKQPKQILTLAKNGGNLIAFGGINMPGYVYDVRKTSEPFMCLTPKLICPEKMDFFYPDTVTSMKFKENCPDVLFTSWNSGQLVKQDIYKTSVESREIEKGTERESHFCQFDSSLVVSSKRELFCYDKGNTKCVKIHQNHITGLSKVGEKLFSCSLDGNIVQYTRSELKKRKLMQSLGESHYRSLTTDDWSD